MSFRNKLVILTQAIAAIFVAGCGLDITIDGDGGNTRVKSSDGQIVCARQDNGTPRCQGDYSDEKMSNVQITAEILGDDNPARFAGWQPNYYCTNADFSTSRSCDLIPGYDPLTGDQVNDSKQTRITATFSRFYGVADNTIDPPWQYLKKTVFNQGVRDYDEGALGSKIDVNNELIEADPSEAIDINKFYIKAPVKKQVSRDELVNWSRWYQEDGNTQIFRVFGQDLELTELTNRKAFRGGVATVNAQTQRFVYPMTHLHLEQDRVWSGRITVIRPPGETEATKDTRIFGIYDEYAKVGVTDPEELEDIDRKRKAWAFEVIRTIRNDIILYSNGEFADAITWDGVDKTIVMEITYRDGDVYAQFGTESEPLTGYHPHQTGWFTGTFELFSNSTRRSLYFAWGVMPINKIIEAEYRNGYVNPSSANDDQIVLFSNVKLSGFGDVLVP